MAIARLLDDLFGSQPHPLAADLKARLGSRRFATFVKNHLTKIRKKLHEAPDVDSARDLLLELETAYRLTHDKRLAVSYEPTPKGSSRGPDFCVRFTTRHEFMIEVTRLRRATAEGAATGHGVDARRLASVVALKLGQTIADRANVLVVGTDGSFPSNEELASLFKELRRDAETTDAQALLKKGFRHRGEYLRRLERLSAVLMTSAPALDAGELEAGMSLWLNPLARVPLGNDVRAVLTEAFADEPRRR